MSAPKSKKQSHSSRPMSPFMFGSVYRWQISSVTSLIHRATGVGLTLTFVLLTLWTISVASGGWLNSLMHFLITSWLGKLAMLLSIWALWYHFLNGIRHLVWDLGYGFDLDVAAKSGMGVIIGSVALTIFTLFIL